MAAAAPISGPPLSELSATLLLDRRTRGHMLVTGLLAIIFVGIYGKLVCPFIDGVALPELLLNLVIIYLIQIGTREGLFRVWRHDPNTRSLPRHGYYVCIASWLVAGLAAMALHALRYEDFPFGSHMKLLSSYWVLGAGILAQWEYLQLERTAREKDLRFAPGTAFLERITRRIMEGYFLFTLGPSLAMLLVVNRYVFEGLILPGVAVEISFLGIFCVLMALVVASHYGLSLKDDSLAVVEGTRRIERGEPSVILDTSRPDEFGEVALSINSMSRELEAQNEQLARQLRELDAMARISRAMSSIMPPESVLDLIMENSKTVVAAEASSLALLNPETQTLGFHVLKGDATEALKSAAIPVGQGIIGSVAADGQSILLADAYSDSRFDPSFDRQTGFNTRTMLTVPMKARGKVVGIIQVINKSGDVPFDEYDQSLMESFAAQATVTLENARLYADTLALNDDLRSTLERERRLSIEKEKMGAFIPRTVVDEINRSREAVLALGGRTVEATMLFSDIKGFTSIAETMDPQDIVNFLNRYMTDMTNIIQEENGIIDKFMGDGIMAIFTQEESGEHALSAVRAGMRMQARMIEMRKEWLDDPKVPANLQMRVGINSGEVVAGNIGSLTRMEYTVIGDNVNVASRIEGVCTPGEVLVTAATFDAVAASVEAVPKEPVHVKNRAEPIHTYEITALA